MLQSVTGRVSRGRDEIDGRSEISERYGAAHQFSICGRIGGKDDASASLKIEIGIEIETVFSRV